MIFGEFTRDDRPIITLTIRNSYGDEMEIQAALDTGFLGSLLLPTSVVSRLNLALVGREFVILADGSLSEMPLHRVIVSWEEEERHVTTYAADTIALIGIELLRGSVGYIEFFEGGEVTIERRS